jgi:hypothetical protein
MKDTGEGRRKKQPVWEDYEQASAQQASNGPGYVPFPLIMNGIGIAEFFSFNLTKLMGLYRK